MAKKGILGKKVGMTQVFTDNGELVPVTVVDVTPNVVLQVKNNKSDGYDAIQLGFDDKRPVLSNKPEQGHVKKAKTTPKRFIREIRDVDLGDYKVGDKVKADVFQPGDVVDVTGTTKGHGYQGNIHKNGQRRGPETHGSRYHRRPGSLGVIINRVVKGMKLPGRMGNNRVTIQNLEVVNADVDNNVLLIKGNVPGANKSLVTVRTSVIESRK
ncbi:50S ribosomal protein L3 [Fructilactobacillus fructivorans]|uniref:Large ribosomal subunit protein uL3 n=1 Tax=Fructilactobacillus fructivorans TaxID=1614 RepID=A0A0C1PN88_9LACO|nr:50S ribosomal protein L3 [Fructilactobacillus fructivorans]KID41396.1 LSU ribosomal protein L3p (L3e) [Fructilactobacillus fructivorans]KRK57116.1 50S ribosomal protein L3 [Fructilactobacillus fructivorans]KRN40359.1 50S ribosomal protein L3 [Fructilactobacillus fructivorans]KRN42645.1 50S ribosomal protein L3 [Fructilactobacillus fructivorans]MCT0151717.1 50S ribosomal protein L3 [Fructilactobacillus fructivorans]